MSTSSVASVAEVIRQRVSELPPGCTFGVREMLSVGPRAAVYQALSRMCRAGELQRPARGVYARPKFNKVLKRSVPVEPESVVKTLAKNTGVKVQVQGAEAARRLGLTTQVATRPVYLTTGPNRTLRLPTGEVRLRHTSSRLMELAGTPAGEALAACLYLGRNEVTDSVIAAIRNALSPTEFNALRSSVATPAWLSDAIHHAESPMAA